MIAAINLRKPDVRRRLQAALLKGSVVGISAIVLYELWYGIKKSAKPQKNAAALSTFLALDVTLWPFELEEAGDIRAELERASTPIGPYDILIAARARRRSAQLVTANASEFACVPGLRTADWSVS